MLHNAESKNPHGLPWGVVSAGIFPNSVMAASGAPFATSASGMIGGWAAPVVSAFTAFACLTSLGSWTVLVGQAGVRGSHDGNFPKIYGEIDKNGVPRKGLILAANKMTILMVILMVLQSTNDGYASGLFGTLTGIAVLLTMLPYFYSCIDLIRVEASTTRKVTSIIAASLGCGFTFIALCGADTLELAATVIVSLIILMFFSWKKGVHHTLYDKPLEPEDAVKQYAASISVQPAAAAIPAATQQAFK